MLEAVDTKVSVCLVLLAAAIVVGQDVAPKYDKQRLKEAAKTAKLAPCQACRTYVNSFKKGMARTERGKFEGGDAAWEEERLGSYSTSEVRLVEIQEKLCTDVERGEDQGSLIPKRLKKIQVQLPPAEDVDVTSTKMFLPHNVCAQCHTFAEEVEQYVDDWWFRKQKEEPDLQKFLCIDTLKYCCPDNHYGAECKPCPGYPSNVCNKNGKCKGAGTRKGNGKCSCDPGYEGPICNICAKEYYEAYRDENKLLCSPCHLSCQGACTQSGPKGCSACKPGWFMDTEKGCMDVNECFSKKMPCKKNEFCVNNEGSYTCLVCDRACDGCQGDGPDMCDKCADGYTLKDKMCVDERERYRDSRMNMTRYITYFGLCIATCIIFQRNTIAASLVGLSVAIYISVSEYFLSSTDKASDSNAALDIGKLLNT